MMTADARRHAHSVSLASKVLHCAPSDARRKARMPSNQFQASLGTCSADARLARGNLASRCMSGDISLRPAGLYLESVRQRLQRPRVRVGPDVPLRREPVAGAARHVANLVAARAAGSTRRPHQRRPEHGPSTCHAGLKSQQLDACTGAYRHWRAHVRSAGSVSRHFEAAGAGACGSARTSRMREDGSRSRQTATIWATLRARARALPQRGARTRAHSTGEACRWRGCAVSAPGGLSGRTGGPSGGIAAERPSAPRDDARHGGHQDGVVAAALRGAEVVGADVDHHQLGRMHLRKHEQSKVPQVLRPQVLRSQQSRSGSSTAPTFHNQSSYNIKWPRP